ncbi:MAG: hypothetical protein KatS3mg083_590 [Candidatus Dojkabacteria bacterium]|nr:MAG: hypothetical protein KatS3mg083_590 [Candidatus Dojkabacteria bacterium]GIW61225.1 MAG: hypothetical protein KatS3mg089_0077 [Patescibacteria group bacterium]
MKSSNKKQKKRSSQRKHKHLVTSQSRSRMIFFLFGLSVVLVFTFTKIIQDQQRIQIASVKKAVLGEDEDKRGEEKISDEQQKNEEEKKKEEEEKKKENSQLPSQGSSGSQSTSSKQSSSRSNFLSNPSKRIVPTPNAVEDEEDDVESNNNLSEREIEVEDHTGQKTKIKIKDDGTTKVELEKGELKIKYRFENGLFLAKVENEDGEEVEMGEEEVKNIEDEIETKLEKEGIKVTSAGADLLFSKNNITALSRFPLAISTETNKLIVTTPKGERVVAVLPDDAVNQILKLKVIDSLEKTESNGPSERSAQGIELTTRNGEIVYKILGKRTYRLFSLIPIQSSLEAQVSAETGQVISVDKPIITRIIDFFSI